MLKDAPSAVCSKCIDNEATGIFSMRQSSNKHFGHYINEVDKTNGDGSLDEFKIRYWDVRFSNICNFRCRSCGPQFSSNWYEDQLKIYGSVKHDKILYPGKDKLDIWHQIQEHIPYIEQIYFAGGEPLIMEEHYRLLKHLVDNNLTHIRLNYNTNFSELKYKKQDVLEWWKKFDVVSIGASLDASGARGEYMRKGTVWSTIEDNRKRMLEVCPNVDFYISATVSLFNVLHLADFHMDWVEKGLIRPQDMSINILHSPHYYRVDVLPEPFKSRAIERCQEMIKWLADKDTVNRATIGYYGLINMLKTGDNTRLVNNFLAVTDLVDQFRNEKFDDVFPELGSLRDYR
jgi:organic radical activating enzyme